MFVAPQALRTVRQNYGALGVSAKEVWRYLCCCDALPNICSGVLRKSGKPKAGVVLRRPTRQSAARLGYGAHAGINDKHTQTRGREDLECGKQRQNLGSAVVQSLTMGRGSKAPSAPCARPRETGGLTKTSYNAKTVPTTTECKRVHYYVVQHSPEWQYRLALEWRQD